MGRSLTRSFIAPALALAALSLLTLAPGLRWGLPSSERADLVLPAAERNPELLAKMAQARQDIYGRSGGNPRTEMGQKLGSGESYYKESFAVTPDLLLLAYSGFLVRSMDPDEQQALAGLAQIKPKQLQFNPHYFAYGGLYFYTLGAWLFLANALHIIRLVPDIRFYYQDPAAMAGVFLAARAYTCVFGGLCVLAVFALGRRLYGPALGLAAGTLAALTPGIIAQAHLLKPHLPGAFFAVLSVGGSLVASQEEESRVLAYLWAGTFAGLAMGCNLLSASVCGLGLAFAHTARLIQGRSAPRAWLVDRWFWGALALMAGLYLLANPYVILAFSEFRAEIFGFHMRIYKGGGPISPFLFWRLPLRAGFGPVSWCAATLALLALAVWGGAADRTLAALLLASGAYVGFQVGNAASTPELVRYFLPGLLLGVLGACRGLQLLVERLKAPALFPYAAAALCLATAPAAYATWTDFVRDTPNGAASIQAGRWINANLPPGSRIGIFEPLPHVYTDPPFAFGKYSLFSVGLLEQHPELRGSEPLPEYAVRGANYSALSGGDDSSARDFLDILGYRPLREFHGVGVREGHKNLLTDASMPFFIYRRAP